MSSGAALTHHRAHGIHDLCQLQIGQTSGHRLLRKRPFQWLSQIKFVSILLCQCITFFGDGWVTLTFPFNDPTWRLNRNSSFTAWKFTRSSVCLKFSEDASNCVFVLNGQIKWENQNNNANIWSTCDTNLQVAKWALTRTGESLISPSERNVYNWACVL